MDVSSEIVCSGQMGFDPLICVWDSENLNTIFIIKWKNQMGISNLCFSEDMRFIGASSMDDQNEISVYDFEEVINYINK